MSTQRVIFLEPVPDHPQLSAGPPPPSGQVTLLTYPGLGGATDCKLTVHGIRHASLGRFYGLYFFYADNPNVAPVHPSPVVFNVSQYIENLSHFVVPPVAWQNEPAITAVIVYEANDGSWYDPTVNPGDILLRGTSLVT